MNTQPDKHMSEHQNILNKNTKYEKQVNLLDPKCINGIFIDEVCGYKLPDVEMCVYSAAVLQ